MKASDIEKKRADRFTLLYELYKASNTKKQNLYEIGFEKGIKNGVFEAAFNYLLGEKLIDKEVGQKHICTISHEGIKAIERAILKPDEDSGLFPPYKEINT